MLKITVSKFVKVIQSELVFSWHGVLAVDNAAVAEDDDDDDDWW